MVEDGQLAVVAQVGRGARTEGQHRHEAADLAAGPADRFDEPPARPEGAESVEEEPHLDAGGGPLGQELHQLAAGFIAAEDEGRDMDLVPGRADVRLERLEVILAGDGQLQPVSADRRAAARGDHGVRHGGGERRLRPRSGAGQRRDEARLAAGDAPELAAADQQIERHPDVGDQDDAEQPGEGVGRSPLLAQQPRDEEEGQDEARDREKCGR